MNAIYVIISILAVGLIVVVHELGHFCVARAVKLEVEEFSIGFGPKLLGVKKKGISYSLRAIPLGGYVRFPDDQRYTGAPVWKRFVTIAAGALMNFVLGFAVIFLLYIALGVSQNVPLVADIVPDTPAAEAGLMAGDRIVAVDGVELPYSYEGYAMMTEALSAHDKSAPVQLTVRRAGDSADTTIEAGLYEEDGRLKLGIYIGYARVRYSLGESALYSAMYVRDVFTGVLSALRNLVFKGEGASEMSGFVGMIDTMSDYLSMALDNIFALVASISVNLGIINLLPLPALDGGRLVFLAIEGIRRKPVPPEKEGMVHLIGMGLILVLAAVLMYQDIAKLIAGKVAG